MQTNSPLPATLLIRGCQIHGVQLDELWRERSRAAWREVHGLFAEGLESGEVVPLQYTIFTDVAKALKYITSGKHKGKVSLLKILWGYFAGGYQSQSNINQSLVISGLLEIVV